MDLMRRISPDQSEQALTSLLSLLPHYSSDLLSQVDQPLQVSCYMYLGFFFKFGIFVSDRHNLFFSNENVGVSRYAVWEGVHNM